MALDGVFLQKVREEMSFLIGGRVDKIHQPSKDEILITLRTKNGTAKLFFSVSAGAARVHITKAAVENPSTPPMFCMLLRKHLNNGKLTDIRQDGQERILYFDFESANELGDLCRLTVAIEIMGRHSNLMLINGEGRIVDSIKRVGEDMSSVRLVLPGMKYEVPPRGEKLSLFDMQSEETLNALLERLSECNNLLSKGLMANIEGISPVFAREAEFYVGKGQDVISDELDEDRKTRLFFYLKKVSGSINDNENTYVALKDKGGMLKDFCFTDINQYGILMTSKAFESPSELLDYFYAERDCLARIKQRSSDLFKTIMNLSERISRRIAIQETELADCADRDKYRIYGDLLMANIYRIEKGMGKAVLENFYDEACPEIEIPLDKRLSPSQNAQKYYNEYKKLDTAEKMLTRLIAESKNELVYIESVFDALTRAKTEAEVLALRDELAEQGYVKGARGKKGKVKEPKPIEYISSDGFTIRAGRNNKQNDKLTLKDSEKSDIWLHTHNIPGSHVIIETNGMEVPDQTILEAAMCAAYNSKARTSSQVPVDYTQVRFVKKPGGAKPGMVIFTNNKTVYVKPDEDLVSSMLK